jgi:hypothetical protein
MLRFRDRQETLSSFGDRDLVKCPHCGACAQVDLILSLQGVIKHNLTCQTCNISKEIGYFNYPSLWLQAPCCGNTLWAYNLKHLEFIEMFVKARLREYKSDPGETLGWSNRSLVLRLPQWLKSCRNYHKEEILNVIQSLRESSLHLDSCTLPQLAKIQLEVIAN